MEEIINDLNKELKRSNTCAKNAHEEVKRLRYVIYASKKKDIEGLSKDKWTQFIRRTN